MAAPGSHELDSAQVKKAIQALFAYQKSKPDKNALLLSDYDRISLMLTVWKIPKREQTIRIPLPHDIRPESCEVCLITKDEPDMTSEQTVKFYKKLLSQQGVSHISEVIPLKTLKKEYKPFEAKRRLLGSYDLFLSDSRVRRFLPSLLGKHFYKAKREPLSVNMKAKYLAAELKRFIQGTTLHITNKGCCYSIRVGHTGMKVEDIVANTVAVAEVLAKKLPMQWKNVKILHLKTQTSVALPVFNSALTSLKELEQLESNVKPSPEEKPKKKKKKSRKAKVPEQPGADSGVASDASAQKQEIADISPVQQTDPSQEEEVPELVPIQDDSKAKKTRKGKAAIKKSNVGVKKSEITKSPTQTDSSPVTIKQKRKVIDPSQDTPSKQRKGTMKDPEAQSKDAASPNGAILKKTPKKALKPALKLAKSSKKASQTPKLKQKKKMKVPQSV